MQSYKCNFSLFETRYFRQLYFQRKKLENFFDLKWNIKSRKWNFCLFWAEEDNSTVPMKWKECLLFRTGKTGEINVFFSVKKEKYSLVQYCSRKHMHVHACACTCMCMPTQNNTPIFFFRSHKIVSKHLIICGTISCFLKIKSIFGPNGALAY